jgi:hypothetical protein
MISSGFIDAQSRDRLWRAVTFPIAETASVYGRHTNPSDGRHRFLARPKGGRIILPPRSPSGNFWRGPIERQRTQLCDGRERTVYLCLGAEENGSGPRAARLWRQRLEQRGPRLLAVGQRFVYAWRNMYFLLRSLHDLGTEGLC